MTDREEIRELIDNWVIWRDTGDWDRFAALWLPEGRMIATFFQASATDFIARARRAWDEGLTAYHSLGGTSIDIQGERAIAQSKMQIIQRAKVHEVQVEVICHGRFWDALERRDGRWGLLLRQPIYEMDRMVPINPAGFLELEPELLASFPEGYRHLGYLQSHIGFTVNKHLPGARGPRIEALQAHGRRWLAGDESACLDLSWMAA
jgi:SnoaL-like domain